METSDFYKFYSTYGVHRNCVESLSNSTEFDIVRKNIQINTGILPSANMVVCGVLAQHGKIPDDIIWSGIHLYHVNKYVALDFLKWYNKELQANGIPYQLLYYEQIPQKLEMSYKPINEVSEEEIVDGVCTWRPCLSQKYIATRGVIIM